MKTVAYIFWFFALILIIGGIGNCDMSDLIAYNKAQSDMLFSRGIVISLFGFFLFFIGIIIFRGEKTYK